jgi:hypothetical protein
MIKIDFPATTRIEWAIQSARHTAAATNDEVEFLFNCVLVRVNANTEVHALYMDFWRACIQKPRFTAIGPVAESSPEHRVVVVTYGEIDGVKKFVNQFQRDSWIDGASYGADKFGGSINLYHEGNLPEEKNLRDNVWLLLLSPAESEEST